MFAHHARFFHLMTTNERLSSFPSFCIAVDADAADGDPMLQRCILEAFGATNP